MRYRRPRSKGETFFFTVSTQNRRPLLCEPSSILSMRAALRGVGSSLPFSLNAFVLLPDHLHCIWTLPENDSNYKERWTEIKRRFSSPPNDADKRGRARKNSGDIWAPGLGEHRIIDDLDFVTRVEYIHYNPVRHGLVTRPVQWPHSTFHRYVQCGLYLPDWGAGQGLLFPDSLGNE